jgi:hypothetical protein
MQHDDDEAPAAPPGLVTALRRVADAPIRVSPQMDESALSRPRLLLSRVREMAAEGQSPLAHEELALAARREKRNANWPGQFGTENPGSATNSRRFRLPWNVLMWTVLLVALAVVVLLLARGSHQRSGTPAVQPDSMQH